MYLPIFIGSGSDSVFLKKGVELLTSEGVKHHIMVASTHREPEKTEMKIKEELKRKDINVIIAGAATATGLPGIIAGYLIETNIMILGVRFIQNPGPYIIEDATFNLSSMPTGVPLAYTGFNEKGFLHACVLAARIMKAI